MKLLFYHNLSHRLVSLLKYAYPDCQHVGQVCLDRASDEVVWQYALDNGLTIVSKDSDFYHRSMLLGHPPKVVWVRLGNCTTAQVHKLLSSEQSQMVDFSKDDKGSFLILS